MAYVIDGRTVRWHDFLLKMADPESFEVLSTHFARDAAAIWVCNKRFEGGNPKELRLLVDEPHLTTAWATDGVHVYRTNLPRIEKKLDARTLRLLDRHFLSDANGVFSIDSEGFLKRVEPAMFRALGGGYGVAGPRVFHTDREIQGVSAETFRSLGFGYASSGADVFWKGIRIKDCPAQGARAMRDHLIVPGAGVYFQHKPVPDADPATFEEIGRHFARDKRAVYVYGMPIPEADPTTFSEEPGDEPVGRDARARYHWRPGAGVVRTDQAAATSGKTPSRDLSAVARDWWAALEAHTFPVLDETFNVDMSFEFWTDDDQASLRRDVVATETEIEIDAASGRLAVRRQGVRAEGSVAGFMHPLAAMWAAARGLVLEGVPCIRLLDERVGYMSPEGDVWRERLLDVCMDETIQLLEALPANVVEGAMLLDLLRRCAAQSESIRPRFLAQEARFDVRKVPSINVQATTNLAAIKRALEKKEIRHKDPRWRVAAAQFLHARVGDLDRSNSRHLSALLPQWQHLLDDPSPRVREVAWETLDFVVHIWFDLEEPEYALCLDPLRRLTARGINLDLNLARLWECATAEGLSGEADEAAARLDRLVGLKGRAPQYPGASVETRTFGEWIEAAQKRLQAAKQKTRER